MVFHPQPQRPFSSIRFTDTEDRSRNNSALSTSPTDQEEDASEPRQQEELLLFKKRPLPLGRSSAICCCSSIAQSNNQECVTSTSRDLSSPSSRAHFHRSDNHHHLRTPSFSKSDRSSAATSDATTSTSSSSLRMPTTPSYAADDSLPTFQAQEHHHHHDCPSADVSPQRKTVSLLCAALLQDDLRDGPQIRAAQWNQACGILRNGSEDKSVDGKKVETMETGLRGEASQEHEVAKRPAIKAHFVEPQKPIRDEKRRVSLPPRIFRTTLFPSPEDDADSGSINSGLPAPSSGFVRRAQSTDASYDGKFKYPNQPNPQPQRGRLVFQEPPQQERRSGARKPLSSNVSRNSRPALVSTRSEDDRLRSRLVAHSSEREVVSDGDVESNAQLTFGSPLLVQQGSTFEGSASNGQVESNLDQDRLRKKRPPFPRPQHSDSANFPQAASDATPSASRKSALTFAASPTAASERRSGKVESKSNYLSDEEANKQPHSDRVYVRGETWTLESKGRKPDSHYGSSFGGNRSSSSPAHARPLSARERIHLSRDLKNKQTISSRSPAHAKPKIRNIMPYSGDAEDEESDEDQDQDSEENQSEDESEDADGSGSEDLDEEEEEEEEEEDLENDDDEDQGASTDEEEEEEEEDDEESIATDAVLSDFNQGRLKRNQSLSRSLDDGDSASILAPSVDSRDLQHPMSFLPSAFEEDLPDFERPPLSFGDVSASNQLMSFVRERDPYSSPPLSHAGRAIGSPLGQVIDGGKRRRSWNLSMMTGKRVGNASEVASKSESAAVDGSSMPTTPRINESPRTPRTHEGGFTPNKTRCNPSQQVSEITQTAVARSPPSSRDAWSALRNYLESPTSFGGSPTNGVDGGGGAFFHLNNHHRQLSPAPEREDNTWGSKYARRRSQGSSRITEEPSNLGSDSYFNNEAAVRSAPSTPPTCSLLASTKGPPSALDLIKMTKASVQTSRPLQSITIVSPPTSKDQDGVAKKKKRRPRTAGRSESGLSHFNKQDLLDRFNPRRRRRSGGVMDGREEMDFGWGRAS